jgi:MoaA/NifB/PqqE/SkfB family radical SAM enzyme
MLQLPDLVLEVTRKCNLRCDHCLRGDAQRMCMSTQVLWNTLQYVESAATLTITGGEPSLAPEVIEEINQQILWKKIHIGYFYIVTNGMPHNRYRRFLDAVERLYQRCDEPDCCVLTVSRDQFHGFDPRKHLGKFYMRDEDGKEWGEFPDYFHPDERKHRIERVLNEGRAAVTQVATEYETEVQKPWVMHSDGDYVLEPLVYVSANGNVASCCNMSFDRIDKEAKGNVLKDSLPHIIESYCTREEEKELVDAA